MFIQHARVGGYLFYLWVLLVGKPAFRKCRSLNPIFASQILSYTGNQTHYYDDPGVSKRLKFVGDPKLGDASISLSDLRPSDTDTFQCKVKMAPGVDMRKVTLVVMGKGRTCF